MARSARSWPGLLALGIAAAVPVGAAAQHVPGTPDLGFGDDGVVVTTIGGIGSFTQGRDVAIDAQHRIVVVGHALGANMDPDFAVLRYLPDGQLDPTFGGDGQVTTPIGPSMPDYARGMAIQPDGAILVAGMAVAPAAQPPFHLGMALVRYLPDGSLDTSFGAGGIVVTVLPYESAGEAIALQPDGKIIVAGRTGSATTGWDVCIVRHHPNGFLDSSFGVGGVVRPTLIHDQSLTEVALTSSGRIVLSGFSDGNGLLIRLRSNGEWDDTFGSFGIVTIPNHPGGGLVLQPDGKLLVPGSQNKDWGGVPVSLARHHANGSLDLGFAADGVANSSEIAGHGFDAALQPDGRIVVAGIRGIYDDYQPVLWRVNPDGTDDVTFYPEPDSLIIRHDVVTAVALQPDGKIVAAGWTGQPGYAVLVARYHGTPPDLIFRDGFESNGLAGWSSSATDSGDLATSSQAAVEPTAYGLRAVVDDTAGVYVQDDSPDDEGRYRARFYIDPADFDPGESQLHRRTRTFIAFQESPARRVAAIVVRRLGGVYSVMGRARLDDNSQADTPFHVLAGAPHVIELDLRRASAPGASDGSFELWVDGGSVATLGGLDNDLAEVDFVRLGAMSVKSGAAGTLSWDEFESRRETYIGPIAPPTASGGHTAQGGTR